MDLPKWNRAKVKRKVADDTASDDALQSAVKRAGGFNLQRARVVFGGIVLIAAVVAVGQWLWTSSSAGRVDDSVLLAEAVQAQAQGVIIAEDDERPEGAPPLPVPEFESAEAKVSQAHTMLDKVAEQAKGTGVDVIAELPRAALLMRHGDFADAEAKYRQFLADHPEHELRSLAYEGVVVALEAQERLEEALEAVEDLVGREGDAYRDMGLWHKGRLLERQGQTDEAIATYKSYMAEYPEGTPSAAAADVRGRLAELDPDAISAPPSAGLRLE